MHTRLLSDINRERGVCECEQPSNNNVAWQLARESARADYNKSKRDRGMGSRDESMHRCEAAVKL